MNCTQDYHEGFCEGLTRYAWWKDGMQMVGSCGATLRDALRNFDRSVEFLCPHPFTNDNDGIERCTRCGIPAPHAKETEQ